MKTASATNAGHAGISSIVRPSLSFTMSNEKEFNVPKKSRFSLRTVPRIKIVLCSLVECCCTMSLPFIVWMMIARWEDLLSIPYVACQAREINKAASLREQLAGISEI